MGRRGRIVFQAPTDLVWSSRLATGSFFDVTALAPDEDDALSASATIASDDDAIVAVAAADVERASGELRFTVTAAGPGVVDLVVTDGGEEVDRIGVQAAAAVDTVLVDAALVGATAAVDPRLPARFAVVADAKTRVLVSAVDRCGEALLDLGASAVVVAGPEGVDPATLARVTADGPASFVVEPAAAGDFALALATPGLADLAWDVSAVPRGAIDEVRAEAAGADAETGTVTLWGRAFVDDVDVVGQDFTWTASERVTLSLPLGPATAATIAFPAADQPPDDRPATVTAEVVGEEGALDLLALTGAGLATARDAPPARLVEGGADGGEGADGGDAGDGAGGAASVGAGCGGGSPCDPFAAAAPVAGLALRRRRRRRTP